MTTPPLIALGKIRHLGPDVTIDGTLSVPPNRILQLSGAIDASDAIITGLIVSDVVLLDPVVENATLVGVTTIEDQLDVTGHATIHDQTWPDGSVIDIPAGAWVQFTGGGVLDFSQVFTILPAPSFIDATFFGNTTVEDTLTVNATSTFNGVATLSDQIWNNGSTLEITGGGTVTAIGSGTLDLSNWTVVIPSPGFNNVTLTGTTTINDVVWVNGSTVTIGAGETVSFIGGGTLDLTSVLVALPASVYNNVTLTGTSTFSDVVWTNGSTVTIGAAETLSFVGGGTLDLTSIAVSLPASIYNNVTLTGTTTLNDVAWNNGATVAINAADTVSFVGGGTLDLTSISVSLPASIYNNVTLTGTTTLNDVLWTDGSTITINAPDTVSFTGGGTLDLTSITVALPASIYNNVTLTGTTTLNSVAWVDGSTVTINALETVSFTGGGTLDLTSVSVLLPASIYNNVTLTGTTTLNNVAWVDGSTVAINAPDTVSFTGGGTLDLTAIIVSLPSSIYNNVTLTGITTLNNVAWVDGSTVTINALETVSFVGGGTLDLTSVLVSLPASIYNNVTLTGTTTLNNVAWVDGSTVTINALETVSFVGGGTLDLTSVLVSLPASIYNNVTLTGTTTLNNVAWVNGSTVTINALETVSFTGGGTLDLTSVNVLLPASIYNNVTLTGTTTLSNVVWTDGSTVTINAAETVSFIGGGTLDLTSVNVLLPASVYNNVTLTGTTTLSNVVWTNGSTVTIGALETVSFVGGGTLDLTSISVLLPASIYNNVTLTGTTTLNNVSWVNGSTVTINALETVSFTGSGTLDLTGVSVLLPSSIYDNVTLTGTTTLNDVAWVNGSTVTINALETVSFIGGGTLDLTSVLVSLPASVYNNVTLTGTTTLNNVVWVDGSSVTINAAETVSFIGGGTLDLTSVLVSLPASVYNNVTLTGTTTLNNVSWTDGSTVSIVAPDTVSFIGGGTLDLTAVNVSLPAAIFNDVTLTGTTTLNDVVWVNGSTVTINALETVSFVGGGTLDLTSISVALPASVYNNVTLTGTTTLNNVAWTNGSTVTIAAAETVSFIGTGTLDLTAVNVLLPASIYNNVTLTGTTTLNDVVWTNGSTVTINALETVSFIGTGTLDLTNVNVLLPSSIYNNVTLTGTTTLNNVQWVNGSTATINALETISFVGGGTLDLSAINVTLPASVYNDVTLTGTTTLGDVIWSNGSNVTIGALSTVSFVGGGTLDLTNVSVLLPSSIYNNVTLTGTTTLNNVNWVNGSTATINALETVSFIGGGTLDLTAINVTLPASAYNNVTLTGTTTLSNVVWTNGSTVSITSPDTVSFIGGGTLDLTAVSVLLPASIYNDVTLTGTTTLNDVAWVNGSTVTINALETVSFIGGGTLDLTAINVTLPASVYNNVTLTGTTTLNNVAWVNGSTVTINTLETISFVGGGTLDLTAVLVSLPASVYNNVTLTGTTTLSDIVWTNGATVSITSPDTVSFIGGGTLDLTAVLVNLPASVYNNVTLTGTTTLDDVVWVAGANVTINAAETVSFIGGGTLDLTSVLVNLPVSVFNNVTLTGTTTLDDVVWVAGANVSITSPDTVSFVGGGTLDLTAISVVLPASVFNNVTLTGTTTLSNMVWTNGSTVSITSPDTVSFVGGGTLDLSSVLVNLPASVFNNVTLTGTTTLDDVVWVNGANVTINALDTVSFIGGGTLDLTAVLVNLPASVFNNVTLTGTTTLNNMVWTNGSTVSITSPDTVSFIGAGTLSLASISVTLPPVNVPLLSTTVSPGSNYLWYNSADDALRPRFGANKLALSTDIPAVTVSTNLPSTANAIPVFNDATGLLTTAATSTMANLFRPLTINNGNNGGAMAEMTANSTSRVYLHLSNTGTSRSVGIRFRSTVNRWLLFSGDETGSDDGFYLFNYQGGGATVLDVNPTSHLATWHSLRTNRYDITSASSNPGSTNTVWYNSASDAIRFFFGANRVALYSDTAHGNQLVIVATGVTAISVPFGFNMMHVFIIGGGGGGGGGTRYTQGDANNGAGGGASAGAFVYQQFTINPNLSYSVEVGVGGTAGTAGNGASGTMGGTGGSTSFRINGTAVMTVAGGVGGQPGGENGVFGNGASGSMPGGGGAANGSGGQGGTCQLTSNFGTTYGNATNGGNSAPFSGGNGAFNYTNAGAGQSASTVIFGGGGGGGPFGGRGGGVLGNALGGTFGCGGGGGHVTTVTGVSITAFAGGVGGNGACIIWYS